jgi:hypothetical protein
LQDLPKDDQRRPALVAEIEDADRQLVYGVMHYVVEADRWRAAARKRYFASLKDILPRKPVYFPALGLYQRVATLKWSLKREKDKENLAVIQGLIDVIREQP